MTGIPRESEAELAKIVLVGPPGSGKAGILKAVAEQYSRSPVRAGVVGEGQVFRTRFTWPEPLPHGRALEVRLFAVSGAPTYNAVSELALSAADGIVFVTSLKRGESAAAKAALQAMVFNAGQRELDLATLPVALQFHPAGDGPAIDPVEMHELLGVKIGAVPCFVTGRDPQVSPRAGVEWVIAEIVRRAENPREAIPH